MASNSADSIELDTAKLLISRCAAPLPGSTTKIFYTRLWNLEWNIKWDIDNNTFSRRQIVEITPWIKDKLMDSNEYVIREHLHCGSKSSPTFTKSLETEDASTVNSILGKVRIASETLNLDSPATILQCVHEKKIGEPYFFDFESCDIYNDDQENVRKLQKILNYLKGKPAGSFELIVKCNSDTIVPEPSSRPYLPFDDQTTLSLVRDVDLPLRWLSTRGDDSGSFHTEDGGYVFQSPFYKVGSWKLALCVRRAVGDFRSLFQEDSSIPYKTVGVLEVDPGIDLASMFDEIYLLAPQLCHPLVLPFRLFEYHVQESGQSFMKISKQLANVEKEIDISLNIDSLFPESKESPANTIAQRPYGKWSKTVYECSTELYDLERRRDFERRFYEFLRTVRPHDMRAWLETIDASSSTRDFDINILPRRIEALTSLIRNLVTQQDSQANIQIARSTMQENIQMRELTIASLKIAKQTKALGIATLKDSNAMKNIAILTTIFLPGTYIASLFSTSMFNFSDPSHLHVSNHIWFYWVITIPLTIVVFSSLQGLIKYRKRDERKKDDGEHGGEKNQSNPIRKRAVN